MTTEQMDWLDDERAGRHEKPVEMSVTDITRHDEGTLYKVRDAIAKALPMAQSAVGDVITEILNAGILFREPAPEYDAVPADGPYFDGEGADVDTRTDAWMGEETTMADTTEGNVPLSPHEYPLIDLPEVTVRRGGMSFAGGWSAPSDTIYSFEPRDLTTWSKKRLREELVALEKRLAKERKLRWKAEKKATRLRKAIDRLI